MIAAPMRKLLMHPARLVRYVHGDLGQPDEAFVLVADTGWLGPREVAIARCRALMQTLDKRFGSVHDPACDIAIAEGDVEHTVCSCDPAPLVVYDADERDRA